MSDSPQQSSSSPPLTTIVPNWCDSPLRGAFTEFDAIYKTGHWGKKLQQPTDFYGNAHWPPPKSRMESASGRGSQLGHNTETSLKVIRDTIAKYNITSMIDVPCGDMNWILDSFETDTLPLYVGLDIASGILDVNRKRFSHHINKQFHFWDATSCVLPKFTSSTTNQLQSFDLVHVRDIIMHLPLSKGIQYFCNIFKSEAKFLITTTWPSNEKDNQGKDKQNREINDGEFYHNILSLEPFSFPAVDDCTRTHPNFETDFTCVYDLRKPWVHEFIAQNCL